MISSSSAGNSNWLAQTFASLLAAPHVTVPGHAGHGPIDLFSTRFSNTFTADVHATVAGERATPYKLKQDLLGLQKHWNTADVKFTPPPDFPPGRDDSEISIICTWTIPDPAPGRRSRTVHIQVSAKTALVGHNGEVHINSTMMINWIEIVGDPSLFVS